MVHQNLKFEMQAYYEWYKEIVKTLGLCQARSQHAATARCREGGVSGVHKHTDPRL